MLYSELNEKERARYEGLQREWHTKLQKARHEGIKTHSYLKALGYTQPQLSDFIDRAKAFVDDIAENMQPTPDDAVIAEE